MNIAYFFSFFDDEICIQEETVEKCKDYKNSMMQKVFSRGLGLRMMNVKSILSWNRRSWEAV